MFRTAGDARSGVAFPFAVSLAFVCICHYIASIALKGTHYTTIATAVLPPVPYQSW